MLIIIFTFLKFYKLNSDTCNRVVFFQKNLTYFETSTNARAFFFFLFFFVKIIKEKPCINNTPEYKEVSLYETTFTFAKNEVFVL